MTDAPRSETGETDPLPAAIGGYRVLARLGAGGMGVVYEAEQASPRRRVALKVLRRGAGGDALGVRLFRREAAALARLRHPAIAAIYESGQTEQGEHFFAMELVHGESMDDWLDGVHAGRRLDGQRIRGILQVVQAICEAVTYAHQRGVIHRDLKPSNVIVQTVPAEGSRGSATPLVKVLDFGLARITDADVELATTRTEVGVLHGTLPYMSPEQVRGDPGEVDTRTDVYSLGVLLYRALTGRLPYAATGVSLPEAMRAIVEDRPRPFAKGEGASLDRDLQTIVLKALEKEPDRRYQSAEALAEDLGRYLADRPILARPPSALYQLRKLVVRHRAPFALAAALLLLLVAFAATMAVQARRIARERDRANLEARTSQRVTELLEGLFEVSDPSASRGSTVTAREVLDQGARRVATELAGEPAVQSRLLRTLAGVHASLGLWEEAEGLYRDALARAREGVGERSVEAAAALNGLGDLHRVQDRLEEAEPALREALAIRRELLGEGHGDTAQTLNNLALTLEQQDRFAEAETLERQALAIRREVFGEESAEVANSLHNLAIMLSGRGELEESIATARRALALRIELFGEDHPWVASTAGMLGRNLGDAARYDEAEAHLRRALEIRRRVLGPEHPDVAVTANNLASVLHDQGKWDAAEAAYREALAIAEASAGELHSSYLFTLNNLASLLEDRGELAAAEPLFRRSLALRIEVFGEDASQVLRARHNLARLLVRLGRLAEAEPLAEEVLAAYRAELGEEHRDVGRALGNLGNLRLAQDRVEEALALLGRAAAVARAAWGDDHPALAAALVDLAAARTAAGEGEAALTALEEARGILAATLPAGHPRLADVEGRLAAARSVSP